jgi:hypothetical protein
VLFAAERDLAAGSRAGFPASPLPDLAAALEDVLAGHAVRHGWGRQLQAVTRSALRVLLATQDTPGAPIPATDVEALTQLAFNNVRPSPRSSPLPACSVRTARAPWTPGSPAALTACPT